MTTALQRPVGSQVSVDSDKYPGVWVVKRNGPANATLETPDGTRQLKAPHSMLIDPVEAPNAPQAFVVGELVRIERGAYAGLWVVIADKGGDRVSITQVGGDKGNYVRAGRRGLVRVDPKDVLKQ